VLVDLDRTPDFVGNAELLPKRQPAGDAVPRRSAETPRALLHDIKYRTFTVTAVKWGLLGQASLCAAASSGFRPVQPRSRGVRTAIFGPRKRHAGARRLCAAERCGDHHMVVGLLRRG
jgi:hypothetical protein